MKIPAWLVWTISGMIICLVATCWWMSLSIHGGNCYELGKMFERSQNPARMYIEDGTPFVFYRGTYYKVKYIAPKTFRAM